MKSHLEGKMHMILTIVGLALEVFVQYVVTQSKTQYGINYAYKKRTWMSNSTDKGQNAVDGIVGTSIADCVTTIEGIKGAHWWRMHLNRLIEVHQVLIMNRGDCCSEGLRDFEIRVATGFSVNESVARGTRREDRICFAVNKAPLLGSRTLYTCNTPIEGRYVTVLMETEGRPLQFCELEVYGEPFSGYTENYAKNKQSWMSTGSSPEKANDGNKDKQSFNCARTNPIDASTAQWWRVDLRRLHQVVNVSMFVSVQCCEKKPRLFKIRVAKGLVSRNSFPNKGDEKCTTYMGLVLDKPNDLYLSCSTRPIGRYVSVLISGDRPLNLCEFEVYGRIAKEIGPSKKCDPANDPGSLLACGLGLVCQGDPVKICLTEQGYSCNSESKQDSCVQGTLCSNGKCRIDVLNKCDSTDDANICIAEATCSTSKTCLFSLHSSCRGYEKKTPCESSLQCDAVKQCKRKNNQPCSKHNECMAGANCVNGSCMCSPALRESAGICLPKTGSFLRSCQTKSECSSVLNADCIPQTSSNISECTCAEDYCLNLRDFTCSIDNTCKKDDDCGLRQVCENPASNQARCRQGVGLPCIVATKKCRRGAVCDKDVCKLEINSSCVDKPDGCKTGASCDNGVCKAMAGERCTTGNCKENAVCDIAIDSPRCKVKAGENCFGELRKHCIKSTLCDETSICATLTGYDCTEKELCQSGSACDLARNKCQIIKGANCSMSPGNCTTGLTCDSLSICRTVLNGKCTVNTDCAAGSYCSKDSQGMGSCLCNADVASLRNGQCEPKANQVTGTCTQGSCLDPLAVCVERNNGDFVCLCGAGYTVQSYSLACKLAPHQSCAGTLKDSCVDGTVCDINQHCHLDAGQTCQGRYTGSCRLGTLCQRATCRLTWNEDCSGTMQKLCRKETVCDARSECRTRVGLACFNSTAMETCPTGAICQDGKCVCDERVSTQTKEKSCAAKRNKVGGECSSSQPTDPCEDPNAACNQTTNTCECKEKYTIEVDFTCKLRTGETCQGEKDCVSGTLCDNGQCKLSLGRECKMGDSLCASGSSCDLDNKCKLDIGETCSGYGLTHCRLGSVCDNVLVCRLPVDTPCNETSQCVAGAECRAGDVKTCRCHLTVSNSFGVLCLPKDGYWGGKCSGLQLACSSGVCDPTSRLCHCPDGTTDDRLYKCVALVSSAKISVAAYLASIFGILLFLLLLIAIIFYRRYKRAKSKEALDAVIKERKKSLAELRSQTAGIRAEAVSQDSGTASKSQAEKSQAESESKSEELKAASQDALSAISDEVTETIDPKPPRPSLI